MNQQLNSDSQYFCCFLSCDVLLLYRIIRGKGSINRPQLRPYARYLDSLRQMPRIIFDDMGPAEQHYDKYPGKFYVSLVVNLQFCMQGWFAWFSSCPVWGWRPPRWLRSSKQKFPISKYRRDVEHRDLNVPQVKRSEVGWSVFLLDFAFCCSISPSSVSPSLF